MAIIKPFKGIRPPKELVEKVESRPYDVLDSEEARAEAGDNEKSLYHIIKPEIDFPVGTSEYDPRVYEKAAENFQKFQDNGWLVQDSREHYYIYAQTMQGKTQYGLVVCAHTDDYMKGNIKKHELTRRDKEEDRMKHVRVNNANIEPVFFAYPDNAILNELIMRYAATEPEYDFIAPIDGFRHQFWIIDDDNDMQTITNEFSKMPSLYIADGHHRSYNRVVKDLNGLSSEEFLAALKKNFEVADKGTDIYKPQQLHEFSLYLDQHWYSLKAKEGTYDNTDPIGVLDVDISSRLILDEILNIGDLRSSKRIDFVGGLRGLGELKRRVDNGEMRAALALYPVTMQQIMDIADSGKIMPPKATWFEPKLRSGLVIHKLS